MTSPSKNPQLAPQSEASTSVTRNYFWNVLRYLEYLDATPDQDLNERLPASKANSPKDREESPTRIQDSDKPNTYANSDMQYPIPKALSAEALAAHDKELQLQITQSIRANKNIAPSNSNAAFTESSNLELGIGLFMANPKPLHTVNSHRASISISSIDTDTTLHTLNLPEQHHRDAIRNFRYTKFNVYRRLFSVVFIANIIPLLVMLARFTSMENISLVDLSTAASANFFVAIMIRQDYVVNILFRTFWHIPHTTPLRIRRMVAKVYQNGGIHSGAVVAGTFWYIFLTAMITLNFAERALESVSVLALSYILLVLLLAIIFFAYPRFRFRSHNAFELSHRWAGWAAIAIFWAELVLLISERGKTQNLSFRYLLIRQPTFWFLVAITVHLILPWLRLRKWHFHPEQLSNHALRLNFDKTVSPLSAIAISESPLHEWHAFATFPKNGGGGSMIISSAGDWTKRTVLAPRTRYWIKGVPKTGVLSMAFVFKRVVIVTSGSGIGPCLSFLLEPSRKTLCRVLWSTPSPLKTYGHDICDAVRRVDPEAVVIDTRESGRPDMVALTYNLFVEFGAEAVFCISNPVLTRKIVFAMESRGVPAFGPIWDS